MNLGVCGVRKARQGSIDRELRGSKSAMSANGSGLDRWRGSTAITQCRGTLAEIAEIGCYYFSQLHWLENEGPSFSAIQMPLNCKGATWFYYMTVRCAHRSSRRTREKRERFQMKTAPKANAGTSVSWTDINFFDSA